MRRETGNPCFDCGCGWYDSDLGCTWYRDFEKEVQV